MKIRWHRTDVTIKACDEFLIKHGLLRGQPTLNDPKTGEVLTKSH